MKTFLALADVIPNVRQRESEWYHSLAKMPSPFLESGKERCQGEFCLKKYLSFKI